MATFILSKPITIDGNEVTEITYREPTVLDYVALGPVMKTNVNPKSLAASINEDPKTLVNYIVRLTGLTVNEVNSLHLKDFLKLADQIKAYLDFTNDTDSTT